MALLACCSNHLRAKLTVTFLHYWKLFLLSFTLTSFPHPIFTAHLSVSSAIAFSPLPRSTFTPPVFTIIRYTPSCLPSCNTYYWLIPLIYFYISLSTAITSCTYPCCHPSLWYIPLPELLLLNPMLPSPSRYFPSVAYPFLFTHHIHFNSAMPNHCLYSLLHPPCTLSWFGI